MGVTWDLEARQVYGRVNAMNGEMQPNTGSGIWGYNLREKACEARPSDPKIPKARAQRAEGFKGTVKLPIKKLDFMPS